MKPITSPASSGGPGQVLEPAPRAAHEPPPPEDGYRRDGATGPLVAAAGIAIAGAGAGATFPLTSSLHVGVSARGADGAVGEVLAAAAIGQVLGPLTVGAIAEVATLRAGLLVLPALVLVAAAALTGR